MLDRSADGVYLDDWKSESYEAFGKARLCILLSAITYRFVDCVAGY